MLGNIDDWIIVIVVALILLGGASKIPELFRNLGRAMGEFRRGQIEVQREIERELGSPKVQGPQSQGEGRKFSAEEIEAKIRELQAQLDQLKREQGKTEAKTEEV